MVHSRKFEFPEVIPLKHRDSIRRVRVLVNQVGSYEGMIKYNYSNPKSLALGVRGQVQKFCDALRKMSEIRELVLVYSGALNEDPGVMRLTLEPFRTLQNTRNVALLQYESIDYKFARDMERKLTDAYIRNSIFCLPAHVRANIYRHLLPYKTDSVVDGIKETAWYPGDTGITRTCKLIYDETSRLLSRVT